MKINYVLLIVIALCLTSSAGAVNWIMNPHTGKLDATEVSNTPGPRGYDGYDGHSYTCAIMGTVRSFNYDANGLNPSPAPAPLLGYMYEDGISITPDSWSWDQSTTNTLITSSGTTLNHYNLSLNSTYNPAYGNNWVHADMTYKGNVCRTYFAIDITKTGDQGIQGVPGTNATITEPNIISAFAGATSDNALRLQPATNSGTVSKFEVRDYIGNVRNYIDSSGYQHFKTSNGYTLARIQSDGTLLLLDPQGVARLKLDNSGRQTLRDFANNPRLFFNASTATLGTYRGNGTTAAFWIYSGGQWRGREGLPVSNGQCLAGNTDGSKYWTTCGSGGGGTPGGSNKQIQFNNNGTFAGSFLRYSTTAGGTIGALIIR